MTMDKFTVDYVATATVRVDVYLDIDHIGGKAFEETIRQAAESKVIREKENGTWENTCREAYVSEFEQDYSEEGVRRHFR